MAFNEDIENYVLGAGLHAMESQVELWCDKVAPPEIQNLLPISIGQAWTTLATCSPQHVPTIFWEHFLVKGSLCAL